MLRRALPLCCWLLLASSPADAEEIRLTVDQAIIAQSNVFKTSPEEVVDASYELTPELQILRENDKLSYDLRYTPSFEAYFTTDQVSGVDNFLRGSIDYSPTRTDTLRLRLDIASYRAIRGSAVDGPAGIPEVVPGTLGNVNRVLVYADYDRQLSRTTMASASLGLQHYGYTTGGNVDSTGVVVQTLVLHELLSNLALGGSLDGGYRTYDANGFQPRSRNAVVNLNFVLRSRPTPTILFDFAIGPAGVFVRQDEPGAASTERFLTREQSDGTLESAAWDPLACRAGGAEPILDQCPFTAAPQLRDRVEEQVLVDYDAGLTPPGAGEDIATFFMRATARRDDAWGYLSLDFFRVEDAAAGNGFTTIRNSLTFTALYRPDDLWSLRFRTNYNQRSSEGTFYTPRIRAGRSDLQIAGPFFFAEASGLIASTVQTRTETEQVFVDLLGVREITDRWTMELGFRYQWQEQTRNDGGPVEPRFDNFLGRVLISYAFDSFEF